MEERSQRNRRAVCHPFLSHAYASEMQMCRGEVFTEGPRRVFTQSVSLRELDQSKSTLVLKGSQKEVPLLEDGHLCVFMTQQLGTASSLHKLPLFMETAYWLGKKQGEMLVGHLRRDWLWDTDNGGGK